MKHVILIIYHGVSFIDVIVVIGNNELIIMF